MPEFYLIDSKNQRKRFQAAALEFSMRNGVLVVKGFASENAARPQHIHAVRHITDSDLGDMLWSLHTCNTESYKLAGTGDCRVRYYFSGQSKAIYLNHGKRGWETVQWPRRLSRLAL